MGGPAPAARVVSDELLTIATEAARRAGGLLAERFGEVVAVVSKSTPTDLASEADLAAERVIRELLEERRPDDELLGEEEGGSAGPLDPGRVRWVFDPLDGTINYLFGVPQWCVSVACEDSDGALAGAVFDPLADELFTATRDGDATLNGARMRPATPRPIAESLVATGFAYDAEVRARQARIIVEVLPQVRDVRRMGSAALDLAWLAAGRYDAYFERTVKPWDIAAGALLCRRVGLEVRDLPARDGLPYGVMAGRGDLLDELARFDP